MGCGHTQNSVPGRQTRVRTRGSVFCLSTASQEMVSKSPRMACYSYDSTGGPPLIAKKSVIFTLQLYWAIVDIA